MRIIICDRCGKKINAEDVRHSMTITRRNQTGGTSLIHCDRLLLLGKGDIRVTHEIDLCDACKASFVNWYGKVGFYET